ncbi:MULTISPECIES: hypothetical protein [Xanthomonas]|uniref:hypothetical protein n=1 Tax=Xanthomonas TaxID=338 RepID=UPI0003485077|nr:MULTISPECIES: hypothetical protein [Xanthomonas]AZR24405.1 hypothetical protein NX81_021475 [Xanthomonas vasicola]MBV6851692.1 hypothetical protein [Xanthomonas campestris pv. heliotropii]MBV7304187.1 hypothetical protein [Xanthomonas vasicola pv. vasculorum]MDO6934549.1 hypothetical protein [Xanthomonas vasicola]MDO6938212.1 hypothetical protein [Xanthomonas vasicola]
MSAFALSTVRHKDRERADLAAHLKAFAKRGGKVQKLGATPVRKSLSRRELNDARIAKASHQHESLLLTDNDQRKKCEQGRAAKTERNAGAKRLPRMNQQPLNRTDQIDMAGRDQLP